ncbi:MAG: D-alanyl-D-alanine carboxypeptidase/D-alanyl-D-alanine endopeptidase [Bacteroidales bacterium]
MKNNILSILLLLVVFNLGAAAQTEILNRFLSNSSLYNASVSLIIIDAETGEQIVEHNSQKSLSQASVMKLVTTAAALELLGPDYRFKTEVGYSGTFSKRTGILKGDIIIKGGGDPCLGSEHFETHYGNFIDHWVQSLMNYGIKKINGQVITDDTRYDYEPVPDGWVWQDIGNYYGAGAYGLSLYDNTVKIHFKTLSEGTVPEIKVIEPSESDIRYKNYLIASGTTDRGYVYCPPYGKTGWISGCIPVNREDFILKASTPDPPLLAAKMLTGRLEESGIKIKGQPSTFRIASSSENRNFTVVTETLSPPLSEIIEVLNHESVNLYAEHLVKEVGLIKGNSGSADAGIEIISEFLKTAIAGESGMFILDGSGLSPGNALTARGIASLLFYMKNCSIHFISFFNSLPEAGKEGTLKNVFRDPVFEGRMRVKSGTMTRVKSYGGYLTAMSGKGLIFCIIVNNFSGSSAYITSLIEELLREIILNL